MVVYWVLFITCAFMALIESSRPPETRNRIDVPWILAMVGVVLLIGLRWQTGGDWSSYSENIEILRWAPFSEALTRDDPAFSILYWLAGKSGAGMTMLTMVSAVVLAGGLTVFCRNQPRPWLALTIAAPYLIIVLGMGYIRQGMALSFVMTALVILQRSSVIRYSLIVACGAAFHSSAAVFIPLAAAFRANRRILTFAWVLPLAAMLIFALRDRVSTLLTNYVDAEYNSTGALIRILITATAGGVFLLFRRRFALNKHEETLWIWMSVIALSFLVLLRIVSSSTAVDRIALYWLPLQLYVFSRLPDAIAVNRDSRRVIVFGVILAYALTLWVWLNFAENSNLWIPYRFKPLESVT